MLRVSVMLNALNAVYLTLLYALTRLCILYEKIIKKNEAERHHLVQQANDWVKTCDAQKEEYENKQLEMEAHHRVQIHEKDIQLNKEMSDNLALANKLAETEEYFSEFVVRHAAEHGLLNVGNQPHGASFHQIVLNADSSNEIPAVLTPGDCNIVNPAGDGNVKGSTASPNSPDRQRMPTKIPRIVKQSGDHKIVKLADDENVKGSTASPNSPDRQRTPTKIPRIVKQSGDHKIVKLADDENVKGSTASPDRQRTATKISRIVKQSGDHNIVKLADDENVKGSTASPNSPDRQRTPTKIPRIVKQSGDHKIVKLADDENVKGSTASPNSPDRQRTPTKISRIVKQSGDHKIIKLADDENVKGSTTSQNCPNSLLSTDMSKAPIPSSIPSNTLKFHAYGEPPAVNTTKVADMEDTVLKLSIQERPRPRFNGAKMRTRITYKKVNIPCSEGAACMRQGCEFTHLSDKSASKKIQCRFGSACRKADCLFQHGYF